MPDWTKPMGQTFEYYIVDPGTWKDVKKIDTVTSCSISRDLDVETLGSVAIDIGEALGECYMRAYLVTIQNGVRERHPLSTFLVQSPSFSFDGKSQTVIMDAYTPLLELKESPPPIGYYVPKKENVMDMVYRLTREHARAPVAKTEDSTKLFYDFVAETDDTWLTFLSDLAANAKHRFDLDEMGRILFAPKQDTASLQPVWTYTDDNSSILLPDLSVDHDLYGIPNVVEVIYSSGSEYYYARVVNDDSNSPISTVNRGREIIDRVDDPDLIGDPTESRIQEYAEQRLRDLSTLEYTVSYKHGYCPVRIGDCVRLNYARAGLNDVKAKVISQNIQCKSGCVVTEKAVFTRKLWR
ncbi:hypothetical protein [Fibrobacter sp.]|uniref:hypothetical protein n=1 Tax=Fibrobacter sp. TaxID=35828 RepID=UPI00388F1DA1